MADPTAPNALILSSPDLQLYSPEMVGNDGYPFQWHQQTLKAGEVLARTGIKHVVRAAAGHRCVRCGHPWPPYAPGSHDTGRPEWSDCDEQCSHFGPMRVVFPDGESLDESNPGAPNNVEEFTGAEVIATYPTGTVQAQWRVLTVHHLNGVKYDCRLWNLAALCQRCHLTIQGKVQMERVWPWEHSDWFKPYVAGYYANVYLGENPSRVEVDDRLEELLRLERQA